MKIINYIGTFSIYLLLGFLSVICIKRVKGKELICGRKQKLLNPYYIILYITYIFFAVFRQVSELTGGSDAPNYIEYFKYCLTDNTRTIYGIRKLEIGFRLFTKIIRYITDDYHWYFFVCYSIIAWAFIAFINEFAYVRAYYMPAIMMFYLYLSSFNTLRTGLSTAFILLSIIFLNKNKIKIAFFFSIISVLFQYGSIFHACIVIAYLVYRKKAEIKKWKIISTILIGYVLGLVCRFLIINDSVGFLSRGSFRAYAMSSTNGGWIYYVDFFKLCVTQFALLVLCTLYRKSINKSLLFADTIEKNRRTIMQVVFLFDILLLPLCVILNVWRTAEFYMLARIVIWGDVLKRVNQSFDNKSKGCVFGIIELVNVLYFIVRLVATVDKSNLIPYHFELF